MQQPTQHATRWLGLAAVAALALFAAQSGRAQSYYGADSRKPSFTGGFEGSAHSPHFHGTKGFHSYPGNFHEGFGPRNDHGHAGEVRKYGRHADAPGHFQAGYLVQRNFLPGNYARTDHRLFHYRRPWGEH